MLRRPQKISSPAPEQEFFKSFLFFSAAVQTKEIASFQFEALFIDFAQSEKKSHITESKRS